MDPHLVIDSVPAARRRVPGLLAAVLAAFFLLALCAAPASAHATLIGSDPAEGAVLADAPDVVTFTFDESVQLSSGSVQAFDATGQAVEISATSRDAVVTADLPGSLADGTYVVVWRVVSDDGHPIAGSLSFSIGAPSATVVSPALDAGEASDLRGDLSAAQALQYVGLLLAAGLVLFTCWLAGPSGLPERARGTVHSLMTDSAGLALFFSALGVPLAGAYQQGLPLQDVLSREALDLDLVGDDLLVLVLQAVGLITALVVTARPVLGGRARLVATAGAGLALLSPALVGHTRSFDPVPLLLVTDVLHLGAGSVWLGGLVGLAITLPVVASRPKEAAALLTRFSTVAAGTLGLLVVTGSLMAWRVLGSWSGLVHTTYGRLLMVKIGIALVVAAIAGLNRFRLLPRVLDAAGHQDRTRGALVVRRAVLAEAGMLVALLVVTGFLVNRSPREAPAVAAPATSQVGVATLGDVKVLATLTPGRQGPNNLRLQLQDPGGEPLDGFAAPEVSLRSGGVDLGLVPLVPSAAGTYEADVVVPAPGTWEVQVSLRETEFDNPVTTLEIQVR